MAEVKKKIIEKKVNEKQTEKILNRALKLFCRINLWYLQHFPLSFIYKDHTDTIHKFRSLYWLINYPILVCGLQKWMWPVVIISWVLKWEYRESANTFQHPLLICHLVYTSLTINAMGFVQECTEVAALCSLQLCSFAACLLDKFSPQDPSICSNYWNILLQCAILDLLHSKGEESPLCSLHSLPSIIKRWGYVRNLDFLGTTGNS